MAHACRRAALGLACAVGLAAAAQAQGVAYTGRMGDRALLVIDGQPRMLKAGDTAQGVRLLGVDDRGARIEWNGRQAVLLLGSAPAPLGQGADPVSSGRIVITAGPGGHFVTGGSIGGHAMQFVVDTGATSIAMSVQQAERAGIAWRRGNPVMTHTANGAVAAHRLLLDRVRIGDVEVSGVEAIVLPHDLPLVLLGNSFLSRFQMQRTDDRMVLTRRF